MDLLDEDQRRRIVSYHREGEAWLQQLPDLVAAYRSRWNLAIGPTYRPGGEASWAAPAELPDGTKAVLKIALPDRDDIDSAAALSLYAGRGVVRLLEHDADDLVSLIERCEPGIQAASRPPAEADAAAETVLPQLWQVDVNALPGIPHLRDIAQERSDMVRGRARRLEVPLLDTGADLLRDLAATPGPETLLHGDFHQRNVLQSDRGWLAIDPRPMLGEPAYDVSVFLVNRINEESDPAGRAADLAARVGVAPDRAHRWLAAQTIQLCSWLHASGEEGPLQEYETAAERLIGAL